MRLIVDLGEMLKIEMGVDLRRGDAGVPHQLLHPAQIARALQHMRGKRVAQPVRIDVAGNAAFDSTRPECASHDGRTDALATLTEKEGRFIAAWRGQKFFALIQPCA